jgi:hypothetical protein
MGPMTGDAAAAVALLQRESVWHLGGNDGCLCSTLSIVGFNIEVLYRKSPGNGERRPPDHSQQPIARRRYE